MESILKFIKGIADSGLGRWILLASLIFSSVYLLGNARSSVGDLTQLLLGGVLVLFVTLTVAAILFKSLDLTDKTQPLGLPTGSVRALIALILILMFAILSIHILNYAAFGVSDYERIEFTEDELRALEANEQITILSRVSRPISGTVRILYRINDQLSQEAIDMGKQIQTTISTLVVAIAGFYFGTRAVSTALGKETPLVKPIITGLTQSLETGILTLAITGKDFRNPKVTLQKDGESSITGNISLWDTTSITCTFTIDETTPKGDWTAWVENDDGEKGRCFKSVTVV